MENHHRILHIETSAGPKFQLQQTILNFWIKFAPQKESFRSKMEKMNLTIESLILKSVQVPNLSLN